MSQLGENTPNRPTRTDRAVGRCSNIDLAMPLALATAALALLSAPTLEAKTPQVRVKSEGELAFGTFMVFGNGARIVGASGSVSDFSITPLEGTRARPARFTIEYDRGNESKHVLDVTLQVSLSLPVTHRQGGVEARLSALETDLPGYSSISSGELIELRFENCRTRICSKSFHVGARLDVNRQFGGANLIVPIDVDARVVTEERR